MFDFKDKVVLVLSPHTDDGEIACGGTISRICSGGGDSVLGGFFHL